MDLPAVGEPDHHGTFRGSEHFTDPVLGPRWSAGREHLLGTDNVELGDDDEAERLRP